MQNTEPVTALNQLNFVNLYLNRIIPDLNNDEIEKKEKY
jgi:hypothetical protein